MLNIDLNSHLFLTFLFLNFLLFKNLDYLSYKIKIFDKPNNRKIHKDPVPILGGIFLFANLIISYFIINFELNFSNSYNSLFIGIFLFFLLGLIDDVRPIGANKKLIISTIFLFSIIVFDDELVIKQLRFSFYNQTFGLRGFEEIFTILCFLLFINALNMFDGINCQSALYSIFMLLNITMFYNFEKFFLVLIIFFIIFCYYNFFSKIFLGDSGTLTLGYILSYFFVKYYNYNFIQYSDEIFLLMLIPGIDMLRVYFHRILNKKNPFKPDQNHLHHYLIKKYKLNKTLFIQCLIFSIPLILYKLNLNLLFCNIIGLFLYGLIIFSCKLGNRLKINVNLK